jgi:hypothetical protein
MDRDIINILKRIEERLDNIERVLELNQKSAKKMDEHIEFVDTVYDTVRKPFSKILTYYNGNTVNIEKRMLTNE